MGKLKTAWIKWYKFGNICDSKYLSILIVLHPVHYFHNIIILCCAYHDGYHDDITNMCILVLYL